MATQPQPDTQLSFHTLYISPIVSVQDYSCRACRGGPAAEEYSETNNIVLMRYGAFSKHLGRRTVTADVNQAIYFSNDTSYRVSHPADCGDRGTVLSFAQESLNDIIRDFATSIDDHPDRPFPFIAGPCSTSVFWRHRQVVQQLETAEFDPLCIDGLMLQLASSVLGAAFAKHSIPRKQHRAITINKHAERAEMIKVYLAEHMGDRVSLNDIANIAHTSPFHLLRVFQEQTGISPHQYLTRLRLRASLEQLVDRRDDLTTLALDLGFSSHSHFSDAFRREFGRSPSSVRRYASSRMLLELSKNLEV